MAKATIVGGGVIGGGWAARFLLNGWDVAVFDPDPEAERKIDEVLANARRSLPGLYERALPAKGRLRYHDDLAAADLIVHEAQGRLSNLDGGQLSYNCRDVRHGTLVASAKHHHNEMLDLARNAINKPHE